VIGRSRPVFVVCVLVVLFGHHVPS